MPACQSCGGEIVKIRGVVLREARKFCSNPCRRAWYAKKYLEVNNFRWKLPTATVGAIHELLVGVDLLRKGYAVFRALSPSSPGDLAILMKGKLLIVEVTTAARSAQGKLFYHKHPKQSHDLIAAVEHNGTITYIPDLAP